MNYQSKTFKLFHRAKLIGTITNVSMDWPWLMADIGVSDAFDDYRAVYQLLTDEEDGWKHEPPLDMQSGWLLEDEECNREGIELPAIHNGNEVWWRWG